MFKSIQPNARRTNNRRPNTAPRTMIDDGTYTMELLNISDYEDTAYGDPSKKVQKIKVSLRLLLPGADAAQKEVESLTGDDFAVAVAAFKDAYPGHGQMFWLDVNRPQYGVIIPDEGDKPSALYDKVLRGVLAEGKHLTPAQLNNLDTALADLIAKAEKGEAAQFRVVVTADPDKGRNKVTKISKAASGKDKLPHYRRIADPREQTLDDPRIVCEVTGERIVGFPVMRDTKEVWYSNAELAETMKKKVGRVLNPRLYREALAEQQAANTEDVPF